MFRRVTIFIASGLRSAFFAARYVGTSRGLDRPTTEILHARRDVILDLQIMGRTVAGLAEAGNIHLLFRSGGGSRAEVRNLLGHLSAAGQKLGSEHGRARRTTEAEPSTAPIWPFRPRRGETAPDGTDFPDSCPPPGVASSECTVKVPADMTARCTRQLLSASRRLESARKSALARGELVRDPGMESLLVAAFRDNAEKLGAASRRRSDNRWTGCTHHSPLVSGCREAVELSVMPRDVVPG